MSFFYRTKAAACTVTRWGPSGIAPCHVESITACHLLHKDMASTWLCKGLYESSLIAFSNSIHKGNISVFKKHWLLFTDWLLCFKWLYILIAGIHLCLCPFHLRVTKPCQWVIVWNGPNSPEYILYGTHILLLFFLKCLSVETPANLRIMPACVHTENRQDLDSTSHVNAGIANRIAAMHTAQQATPLSIALVITWVFPDNCPGLALLIFWIWQDPAPGC